MPLPEMRTAITARALVCDKITVYVQVHVRNLPQNFLRALSAAFGFKAERTDDGGWGYWLRDLALGMGDIPTRIQASIINRENVGFTVEMSPLRAINRNSLSETRERAPSKQTNWIKAADIRANNMWAVRPVANLIPTMRGYCVNMVEQILETRPTREGRHGELPRIVSATLTLRQIEIAYDFFSLVPNISVAKFEPLIAALCPTVSYRRYPRARTCRSVVQNGVMVEGFIHPGERIKCYVKAYPNRVRLELTLSEAKLREYAHPTTARSRNMAVRTAEEFLNMYDNLSGHTASRFQDLIRVRLCATSDGTAVQLYAELLRAIKNFEAANAVLDSLVTHQRLLASEGRNITRALLASGILASPRRHGIYPISNRFRRAVELIASTPGFLPRSSGSNR